jgi:hypothetical protein
MNSLGKSISGQKYCYYVTITILDIKGKFHIFKFLLHLAIGHVSFCHG